MAQPVVHFEIWSKDRKKAQEFYQKAFDWDISEPPGMEYGMVGSGGEKSIGGGIASTPDAQTGVTFYIQVDDIGKYLSKIESLGGKTVVPETPIPGVGAFAMFADPDGNVLGVFRGSEEQS